MKFILFFSFTFYSIFSLATCPVEDIIENEYLVRIQNLNTGLSIQNHHDILHELRKNFSVREIHNQKKKLSRSLSNFAIQSLPPTLVLVKDTDNKIFDLESNPQILSIEHNCKAYLNKVPNDPSYSSLWAHEKIQSPQAWEISTGSREVVIAISDNGVDYRHEDLKDNMWINLAEQNGRAGIDDDDNGYIDDVYGYDFADRDPDPSYGNLDGSFHGTHVAGSAGAVGNNGIGVSGVVWQTRMMALKGFRSSRTDASTADLLESIYYAADNGARVVNCSWGGNGRPNEATKDAIIYALSKGTLPIVAAGNSTMNAADFSPAAVPEALTVGASNPNDGLASFSNFGSVVDVIAPGTNILSTFPMNAREGKYSTSQGTSMAAPYVAGLAALILSINPSLSAERLTDIIKDSGDMVDVVASDRNRSRFTYPRINAYQAALAAKASLPPPPENPCDDGTCDENQAGLGNNLQLAKLKENGCSYAATASNSNPFWILLLPLALLLFRKRD